MKDLFVVVDAPTSKHGKKPQEIRLPSDASLYSFRQKCAEVFSMDVLLVTNQKHKRITDIEELEREPRVAVYDTFYQTCRPGSSTNPSTISEPEGASKQTLPFPERALKLRVETIGLPGAGKTSLIWRFVKNEEPPKETHSITEVVFEKELDLLEQAVHFSITDVKETQESWANEDRMNGKRVLLFCVPNDELTVQAKRILDGIFEARQVSPGAVMVLAVTKSDLPSAENPWAKNKPLCAQLSKWDVMVIQTSIFDGHVAPEVVTPEELFVMIAKASLKPRSVVLYPSAKLSYNGARNRSIQPTGEPPAQPQSDFWYLQPFRSITSCFSRNAR